MHKWVKFVLSMKGIKSHKTENHMCIQNKYFISRNYETHLMAISKTLALSPRLPPTMNRLIRLDVDYIHMTVNFTGIWIMDSIHLVSR